MRAPRLIAGSLIALLCLGAPARSESLNTSPGGISGSPFSGASVVSNIFTKDFTANFGAVAALVGTSVTQTVTGLLTTDQVHVQCLGTMTAGATIANAWVSAANTLEITFTTAVATGITLGSLNWRVTVIR